MKEKALKIFFIFLLTTVLYFFGISYYWIIEYRVAESYTTPLLILDIVLQAILIIFPGRYLYKRFIQGVPLGHLGFTLLLIWQLYLTTETSLHGIPFKLFPIYNLAGYFMIAILLLPAIALFKSTKIYFIIIEIFLTFWSVLHYYIISFRGGPIMFSDIDNIRSAGDITDSYPLFISATIIVLVLQLAFMIYFTLKRNNTYISKTKRLGLIIVCIIGSVIFWFSSSFCYNVGIRMRYLVFGYSGEENTQSYRNCGNLLTLYYTARYERYFAPEGYDADEVASKELTYTASNEVDDYPTIVCIMNESFSDFSHISEFDVSEDYMPFYRSLSENAIKGKVTVSAYGGYSCNSEWEFLTGNSMFFLPSGYAAYTNCMNSSQTGIVSALNDLGYETTSIAMCTRSMWNIENAYNALGFSKQYYSDNINLSNPEYLNGCLTDRTAYKKLIELYENRDKTRGAFYWLTTMQNHAEYHDDIDSGISLNSPHNVSAERYLNLIKESDDALEELLRYFGQSEEKVIVVFFGDHYPHIPSFTEALYGDRIGSLGIEDYSRLHQTPFLIWSNSYIEAQDIRDISLNYLGGLTLDVAGLPKTCFENYLSELRPMLPIITGFGYMDAKGIWHSRTETENYQTQLDEYARYEYYHIFGK